MKKLNVTLCNLIPYCLFLLVLGCGGGHEANDHHSTEHGTDLTGESKSQEELLSLSEANDVPGGEASLHPEEPNHPIADSSDSDITGSLDDFKALLGGHSPVGGEPVAGAGLADAAIKASQTSSEEIQLLVSETNASAPTGKLEDIAEELDASNRKDEERIEALRELAEKRNDTINTLKRINQQLRDQISQLRRTGSTRTENVPVSSEIQALHNELLKNRNVFILKVKELDDMREYNKQLLEKLDALDITGNSNVPKLAPPAKIVPEVAEGEKKEKPIEEKTAEVVDSPVVAPLGVSKGVGLDLASGSGSLEFEAVVTAANGKIKEAFYTEFFITKVHLRDILHRQDITLQQFKDVSSHAELWARSRKSPFSYPNLQKKIRKALLDSIDDVKSLGRRIRTDIDGNSGEIKALEPGQYYVIGTASLGKVGVTWSVPVQVKSGHNKLSLTIANADWSL